MRVWRFSRALLVSFGLIIGRLLLLTADLASLAGLAAHYLTRVTNTLALVGVNAAHVPYLGGHLPHQFLVYPGNDYAACALHLEGDPRRRRDLHRMGVADLQDQVFAALLGPISNAPKAQH